MNSQNPKSENSRSGGRKKTPGIAPRRRGQGDIEPTTPKSYTLPVEVVLEIRHMAPAYGSQGRALQVGSELLTRMRNPPAVAPAAHETLMRMTYKLTPRTIRLIDKLAATRYKNAAQAIAACLKTLKMKKID
jgi:hypothetical protein